MSFSDLEVPATVAAAPCPRPALGRHQTPDVVGMVLRVELRLEAKRESEVGSEGGFCPVRSRLEAFQVMKMDLTVVFGNNDMGKAMAARFEQRWKEEIERAVDKVKMGLVPGQKRTATDRWFRRMWYINEWRMKRHKGPSATITRD
jgi:hypothetical protein